MNVFWVSDWNSFQLDGVGYNFRYVFFQSLTSIIVLLLNHFTSILFGNEQSEWKRRKELRSELMTTSRKQWTLNLLSEWAQPMLERNELYFMNEAMRHAARERNAKNWSEVNAASDRASATLIHCFIHSSLNNKLHSACAKATMNLKWRNEWSVSPFHSSI